MVHWRELIESSRSRSSPDVSTTSSGRDSPTVSNRNCPDPSARTANNDTLNRECALMVGVSSARSARVAHCRAGIALIAAGVAFAAACAKSEAEREAEARQQATPVRLEA